MMTPTQLREHEFKASGRNAYKADDVDAFIAELSVDYEKMFRENGELIKRVSLLADRLEKYKNDEGDIKNAVMSAQKAAEMIIKDAESAASDSRSEAEAVLSAAKSEAEIIKNDAQRQAIADSELLLSMTRDKAQEIIKKAKEEAGSIILNAKSSASDKVGAATRTVTSETLLYDMLKKEVSDFKASILSQYKAHIELISKLPEIAAEEAKKLDSEKSEAKEQPDANKEETASFVSYVEAESAEEAPEETDGGKTERLEFSQLFKDSFNEHTEEVAEIVDTIGAKDESENSDDGSEKEKPIEFVNAFEASFTDAPVSHTAEDAEEEPSEETEPEKEIISDFSLNSDAFSIAADDMSEASFFDSDDESGEKEEPRRSTAEDVPISRGFSINHDVLERFDNKVEVNDDDAPEEKKRGFFKRKR
ncbi:MAG: DivIVA domain-containing protein [Oscillospiraceae bacterium]|nr:DivIVA domain-containing protein [Oscillospiraceae bacterium]